MQNPLSLRAFLSWVEKQPADKEYRYFNNEGCAFAQYLRSLGFEDPSVGGDVWDAKGVSLRPIPKEMVLPLAYDPSTFGGLASRLRKQVQ